MQIREKDLLRAAAFLRKNHPGLCRIDNLQLIVPSDPLITDTIRTTLAENGIEILSETPTTAALDDVFASLTAPPAVPAAENAVQPEAHQKEQGADDDD